MIKDGYDIMNKKMSVAIMMCCYNRKEKTRACLESILQQIHGNRNLDFDLYVYDDHSTDGTVEMIKSKYPQVTIFEGKGNAYWCKSMHYLMHYTENKYNYYLMVNDDVEFYQNAIQIVFESYEKIGRSCGIVGACQSKITGEYTYGGRDERQELVLPAEEPQTCSIAEWNCFFIDNEVIAKVGIIDGKYQHACGDYDYSFRMIQKHVPIYVATGYVGACEKNSYKGTCSDISLTRWIRFKKLLSPKGLPFYSLLRFNCKTKGILIGLRDSVYGYASRIYYIIMRKEF